METEGTGRAQSGRYLEIADELRELIPKMKHPEVAEQLRLLVISYERLAEHAEGPLTVPQPIEGALP